jgi:endonuclease-3 related protein
MSPASTAGLIRCVSNFCPFMKHALDWGRLVFSTLMPQRRTSQERRTSSASSPQPREAATLRAMYEQLMEVYGPQHWWPAETPLEVTIGAYLTQNTSWKGVERSIANLRERGLLDAAALLACPEEELRVLLRPSGYMVRKSAAVRAFLGFLFAEAEGSFERLAAQPLEVLRPKLLALPGVGLETADAILLYALGKPAMVVDEYLRRVTMRHGLARELSSYDELQRLAWAAFADVQGPERVRHANEFHALIVMVGKTQCGPKPRCAGCPLACFPALLPEAKQLSRDEAAWSGIRR